MFYPYNIESKLEFDKIRTLLKNYCISSLGRGETDNIRFSTSAAEIETMMQQTKELPACPVETTLMLIGDKWKVLILRDLMPGTKRFGELKKSIGSVSQKVLTAQLRDMEEKGLVNRHVYAEVPPRVEYSLTDLGKSLKPILDAMWTWGEGYKATIIN